MVFMKAEDFVGMLGIIPAAGNATRFGGAPKFLLPIPSEKGQLDSNDENPQTLIRAHADMQSSFCDEVVIVTRPEWYSLIADQVSGLGNVTVFAAETKSISHTLLVARAMGNIEDTSFSSFFVSLPDTYFKFDVLQEKVREIGDREVSMEMFCWASSPESKGRFGEVKIDELGQIVAHIDKPANPTYGLYWGALRVSDTFMKHLEKSADNLSWAIDCQIKEGAKTSSVAMPGTFFDVGTMSGYQRMLTSLET